MVFKFTIDKWLNPYIPPSFLHRLPKPVRYILGAHEVRARPDYLIWLETLLATFSAILLLEGIFRSHTVFTHHNAPIIIASYGASAILLFNASQSPLAQPRNVIMGSFVSSLIGVCLQKLFLMGAERYLYIGGGLSVAISSVVMSILNCVHPPAGASALLPLVDADIRAMGWWYLPAQLVSSTCVVAVACITGNIFRKYPVYWWTPDLAGSAIRPQQVSEPADEEPEDSESVASTTDIHKIIQYVDEPAIEVTTDYIKIPSQLQHHVDVQLLEQLRSQLKKVEKPTV